jgi:hypothetical protein
MREIIAEEHVRFILPNGTTVIGRIAITAPVPENELEDASCEVILEGLESSVAIRGSSTLQALILGAQFVARRLHQFSSEGGRILYRDENTEIPLRAIFASLLES